MDRPTSWRYIVQFFVQVPAGQGGAAPGKPDHRRDGTCRCSSQWCSSLFVVGFRRNGRRPLETSQVCLGTRTRVAPTSLKFKKIRSPGLPEDKALGRPDLPLRHHRRARVLQEIALYLFTIEESIILAEDYILTLSINAFSAEKPENHEKP